MLTASGVFLLVSHGAPDTRLHLLEQHDIDEPYFTPWVIEVQAIRKYIKYKFILYFLIYLISYLYYRKT